MKPLTKSLHTVTAVSRVAEYLSIQHPTGLAPARAVDRALRVLGYDPKDFSSSDPTVLASIEATRKLI